MDYFYVLGVIGAFFVLIAFFMHNYKDVDKGTLLDEWLNLLGAGFLFLYALENKAWPFVVLNAVWAFWSGKVLLAQLFKKENTKKK